MRSITTVPTEIWDCIITGACTDGGYTGRSLALTNRFFHSQSLSNRLTSLRLTSLARVEMFLSFLGAQDKECKPKIRHLFLSFQDETEPIGQSFVHYLQGRGPPGPPTEAFREWAQRFIHSMTMLFSLSALTLRSLCVVSAKPSILPVLPAFPYGPFPVLEELTLHQSLDLFFPGSYACRHIWTSNFTFQLPALRRFHVIQDFWPLGDLGIFPRLTQYNPPNLTHARISGLSIPPTGLLNDLRTVLGLSSAPQHDVAAQHGHLSDSHTGPLLPTLGTIIIHGCSPDHSGPCGTINFDWLDFNDEVRHIGRLARENRDVTIVPLCRAPRRNWRWPERLFDDWVSRIEGGAGCWVESEDEEAKLEIYEDDPPLPEVLDWPLPDSDDDL